MRGVAAWVIALAAAAIAGDALEAGRLLAEAGRPEEAVAAYEAALAREDLSPEERATARYRRALILERELDRPEEALLEYRRYLDESRGVLPRTTELVEDKVAELEACLGADGELRREIARVEAGRVEATPEEAQRLLLLLREHPGSRAAAEGWLALARLCQEPALADWRSSLRYLDVARAHGAPKEEVEAWRRRAEREFLRARIDGGCVALASLLLSATLCLAPWRRARRSDWVRAAWIAVPGLALAAAWGALWWCCVRGDPESPITWAQGPVLLGMAAVILLDATLLSAALRGRQSARVLVPLAALLLTVAGAAIFCFRFDYFPLFGW